MRTALKRCNETESLWNKNVPLYQPAPECVEFVSQCSRQIRGTMRWRRQETQRRLAERYNVHSSISPPYKQLPALRWYLTHGRLHRYEWARGQVTGLPLCQGMSVKPSGRFPFNRRRLVDSLVIGKLAEVNLRTIKLLTAWYQADEIWHT